jgi:hypothetical protein
MKLRPRTGQDFRPRALDIIQHEGNELNFGLLGRRIGGRHWSARSRNAWLDAEIVEKISPEQETERENDDSPANAKPSAHSATGTAILEIWATSARCP